MDEIILNNVKELDWDCAQENTQYLTHSIHRYSGKFIPQIAKNAIELLTEPGDIVLDPYCGSGTTLLECALSGRRSIGFDLNPLAVLIAKVKTTPIEKILLDSLENNFIDRLKPLLIQASSQDPSQLSLFGKPNEDIRDLTTQAHKDWRWTDDWYCKWFAHEVRAELIILHNMILQEKDINLRNVALLSFSDILRKSSNANSSYPNVMFDKNRGTPPPAIPRFIDRLEEISRSIATLTGAFDDKPLPIVLWADARKQPIPDCCIDAIVTHPPYIGSIPYAEYGVLSLSWLGYDYKELDRKLTGGKRQTKDVIDRFRVGFKDMILESFRVLKPHGAFFMLLGNPTVRGKRIDLSQMAQDIALRVGFRLDAIHHREGINRRANLMGLESLLFFRKKSPSPQ
jgi:SAM-dependent methyltransferase